MFQPTTPEQLALARKYMTSEEKAWIGSHGTAQKVGDSKAGHRRASENAAEKRRIEAVAYDRAYRAVVAEKVTAKAAADREAKAAAERAEAIRREGLTPLERELEDDARDVMARLASRPPIKTDRPKPEQEAMPTVGTYLPPPADSGSTADALAARAKDLEARYKAEPSEANRYQAMNATAEAATARALERMEAEQKAAKLATEEAVRQAGDSPVAREQAKAKAAARHADRLGESEQAYLKAIVDQDRVVVETARACHVAAHRIESRKAQMAADEAKAANDPQRLGNPFFKPPTSLADWQFEALSPADQRQALDQGMRVYDDPAPPFTAEAARSVIRSRGGTTRVVTRAEFDALPPAEQGTVVKNSIILDD